MGEIYECSYQASKLRDRLEAPCTDSQSLGVKFVAREYGSLGQWEINFLPKPKEPLFLSFRAASLEPQGTNSQDVF